MSTPWEWGPPTPALETHEAHVWLVFLGERAATQSLSNRERSRAERFIAGDVRDRFVAAHVALRDLLARYCGQPAGALEIETPERGKPYLPAWPALKFNLSHSAEWALVAVAREAEVGVDLEEIRPEVRVVELAQRFLAPAEAEHLAALGPTARLDTFFRYWTCKEAFVKALGRGFDLPLRRFTVALGRDGASLAETAFDPGAAMRWTLLELSPLEGFRAALCLEAGCKLTSAWRWHPGGTV